jgi:signal transduction histidine kinase
MMHTTTIQKIDQDNALALDMSQTKLDDALILAQCTYKSATEIGYDKGIADSLLAQAQVNYHHAHYEHALLQLGRALAIYENLHDIAKSAHVFSMMGNIFRQIGDFASAIDAFSKSLNAARALNDQLAEMRALNGLASIYGHSHQPSTALNYLKQALTIAKQGDFIIQQAAILGNMCHQYTDLGDYDQALSCGLECWAIYQRIDNPPVAILNASIRISQVYYERKEYQKAFQFANHGLSLAYQFNARNDIVQLLHHLGVLYADMGREEEALGYVQEAITQAKTHHVEISNYGLFLFAAQLYKKRGDYQQAYEALEQYHEMRLMLYNEESEAKMHQLEARYKLEAARKEAELYQLRNQELEKLREQDRQYFERLTAMKDKFIREASHDLKNPLSIILLNTNIAERMVYTDPQRVLRALEQIRQQTLRSKDLVTELLDLAWLETGRAIQGNPVHLVTLANAHLSQIEPLATEKNITLQLHATVPDDLTVMGDEKQLARVFDNLLSNAIKYTPNGGRVVVDIQQDQLDDIPYVTVAVRDTGIGLTAEQQQLVFEPFYKAHDDIESDSTGLGLTIVQAIIKQHGGSMFVQSEVGQGSVFGFRLMLA